MIDNDRKILRARNSSGDTTASLPVDNYVRILIYGGAKKKSDNSAFYYAASNVAKDYQNDKIIFKKAYTGKDVVSQINKQKDNSIQSIDFFTHGSQYALYMVRDKNSKLNSSTETNIDDAKVESNNLYASKTVKIVQSWFAGDDEDVINNIDYKKFTNTAKIEIHGCNSGAGTYMVDNIAINLSEYLYENGRTKAVVIAHLTKANPNINDSKTKIQEQDYRHGSRIIYNNGKEVFRTAKKGRITASEINSKL